MIAAFVVNYKNITNPNLILITIVLVGYSLIGFIDDALIILKHQNEGLKAWQKFLMQAILAVGCYLYLENFVPGFTTEVTIPIVKVNIDFGWFYAVLVFIMFTGEVMVLIYLMVWMVLRQVFQWLQLRHLSSMLL